MAFISVNKNASNFIVEAFAFIPFEMNAKS